jgi:hypothetical protein
VIADPPEALSFRVSEAIEEPQSIIFLMQFRYPPSADEKSETSNRKCTGTFRRQSQQMINQDILQLFHCKRYRQRLRKYCSLVLLR